MAAMSAAVAMPHREASTVCLDFQRYSRSIEPMKGIRLVLFAVGCLVGAGTAEARLGETLDQCIARFGPVTSDTKTAPSNSVGESAATFQKNGFVICAIFLNGAVQGEVIEKVDKDEFTEIEKQTLLDSESAGQAWTKRTDPSLDDTWDRTDGTCAIYQFVDHSLTFFTSEYLRLQLAATAAAQKSKLKDF